MERKNLSSTVCLALFLLFSASLLSFQCKRNDSGTDAADTIAESLDSNAMLNTEMTSLSLGLGLLQSSMDRTSRVLSPASLQSALRLLAAGANGITREELQRAIGSESEGLWKKTYTPESPVRILGSSSIWLDPALRLDSSTYRFNELNAPELFSLSFKRDPKSAADAVNGWVSRSTQGMISNLVTPSALSNVELLLASALYFNGVWEFPFDEKLTAPHLFQGSSTRQDIPFMQGTFSVPFVADTTLSAISLPFADSSTRMMLILPHSEQFDWRSLTPSQIQRLYDSCAEPGRVFVKIPRFDLESALDLTEPLRNLALPNALASTADYSAFTGSPNGLTVSSVLQNSKFTLTERGVEAASATAIIMVRSASVEKPFTFVADHPFLFIIYRENLGQVLFMGYYDR